MRRVWRTVLLLAGLVGLGGMFLYVMMRSGPLAPVPVTAAEVRSAAVSPALFGIGVVESGAVFRWAYLPGRVKLVGLGGDWVEKRRRVAVMDPVDMDEPSPAQGVIARLSASVKRPKERRRLRKCRAHRSATTIC